VIEILQEKSPQDNRRADVPSSGPSWEPETWRAWQVGSGPIHKANSKQALLAFKGDGIYRMAARKILRGRLCLCQQHLRMPSPAFTVSCAPLDMMQPYRLEMGPNLGQCRAGKDLLQFSGAKHHQ